MSGPSSIEESHHFPIHMLKVLRFLALEEKMLEAVQLPIEGPSLPMAAAVQEIAHQFHKPLSFLHTHVAVSTGRSYHHMR